MRDARENYRLYRRCVLHLTCTDQQRDQRSATCFHIGDGFLVTARHAVDGMHDIAVTERPYPYEGGEVTVGGIFLPTEDGVDLAVLESDFHRRAKVLRQMNVASAIAIGSHLDDMMYDDDFVLNPVLVMGYPPIPQSRDPVPVAVDARVVAVIDKYTNERHPHFVLSSIPRGGFSGGPVIMQDFLLGVLTQSLLADDQPLETGFAAALTVEPLLNLLVEHRIFPAGWNGEWVRSLTPGETVDENWFEMADPYTPRPPSNGRT